MSGSDPDTVQVEVWDYQSQNFIASYHCAGERRVRVDHHGSLSDLAVFEVDRMEAGRFLAIDGNKPLTDWRIDYT